MRCVSEKVLDEKIAEMRQTVGIGHGMFDTQLIIGIHCLETLKACCLEEIPEEKLRPMVDVPINEYVLCLTEDTRLFECMIKRDYFDWMTDEGDDWYYPFDKLLGWIPMPKAVV